MYKSILRPFLFKLDPEKAHHLTFTLLKNFGSLGKAFLPKPIHDKRLEREVFGLKFPNPVGLAAGLDKNAVAFREFAELGFGFVEMSDDAAAKKAINELNDASVDGRNIRVTEAKPKEDRPRGNGGGFGGGNRGGGYNSGGGYNKNRY